MPTMLRKLKMPYKSISTTWDKGTHEQIFLNNTGIEIIGYPNRHEEHTNATLNMW